MRTRNVLAPPVTAVAFALSAFLLLAAVEGAETQAPVESAYVLNGGMNEFGFWAGGSPDSNVLIGKTPDTELALFGLRYGRVLAAWEALSLQYTFDILPAAFVFAPDRGIRGGPTIYGAGLSPLGFKVNFGQRTRVKPFVGASVGFLYFERDVPVRRSSRFNFTPEVGFGVQFFLTPKQALTIGYKYHHMSNAGTSRRNPGLDSNVLYAGFSFFTP